jgi:hypothetical protein
MRIDNPSVLGSLSFLGGTNTISATSVSLTGSLTGTFEGSFSSEVTNNISGAFDSVSASLASDISLNRSSIDSINSATSSFALQNSISGAFEAVSASIASDIVTNYLRNTTDTLDGDLTVTGTGSFDHIDAQSFYTVSVIGSNTNAVNNTSYVLTASVTLTLPASPSVGNRVLVSNQSGTTTPVIGRNGNLISGLAEDLTIDVDNLSIELLYTGATKGWIIL